MIGLTDGYHPVPDGKLAAVVTSLEMTTRPPTRPMPPAPTLSIATVTAPTVDWYRDLYERVGADWIWASRLKLSPAELAAIITHPDVAVYALMSNDSAEGLLELDFRVPGICELAFFGVTPHLVGTGSGRHLMQHAIQEAWTRPIHRFWVHTCSLDHPGALAFYRRSGFVPFKRQIEIFDDPRLSGVLPRDAAPEVPIL